MDKIAQIKLAETHGVLAALADTGLLKVASEEDFDFMTEKVAEALGDDYDMDQVISKTAGCEYLMDKIASEEFAIDEVAEVMDKEACTFADLGEFLMLKEAAKAPKLTPFGDLSGMPNTTPSGNVPHGSTGIHTPPKVTRVTPAQEPTPAEVKSRLQRMKDGARSAAEKAPQYLKDRATGQGILSHIKSLRNTSGMSPMEVSNIRKALAKNVAGTAGIYGIPTAAALYGGKKLYDRFKSDK